MPTLERITVSGFKSIRELKDFKLGQLNVLIGANGAGKSNFISVFKLLEHLAIRRLQTFVTEHLGADSLLYFGSKVTNEIFISLDFRERLNEVGFGYEVRFSSTNNNQLYFSDENAVSRLNLFGSPDQRVEKSFGGGHLETYLDDVEAAFVDRFPISLNTLKSWKVYHFHDTSKSAPVKQNADIHDNHSLKPDAKNLSAFLYLLQNHHRPYYDRIVSTIRLAAPFFDDFILRPMPENALSIRLRWRHRESGDDWDISQLSDGTLRFICLATLLLQPELPSLILIDEPELGLHPSAITLLTEMLRSAATKSQVIVCTHSVQLVNQMQPEEVIVVERKDNQSTFKRLETEDYKGWLNEYSLGELWEMNVIGGRP